MSKYTLRSFIKKLIFSDLENGGESRVEHDNQTEVEWKKVIHLDEEEEDYVCFEESELLDLINYLKKYPDNFIIRVPESCLEDDEDEYDILDDSQREVFFLLSKTNLGKYDLDFQVVGILRYSNK